MKTTNIGLMVLLLAGLVLSGCVQNPPAYGGDNVPTPDVDTAEDVVGDLTGGTGTGPDDITTQDLDSLQEDLDELDVGTDELSESDI